MQCVEFLLLCVYSGLIDLELLSAVGIKHYLHLEDRSDEREMKSREEHFWNLVLLSKCDQLAQSVAFPRIGLIYFLVKLFKLLFLDKAHQALIKRKNALHLMSWLTSSSLAGSLS